LRFYEEVGDKRTDKKLEIGTVVQFPHRWDAHKVALALRARVTQDASIRNGENRTGTTKKIQV
jgi:hypothetical protein